MVSNTEISEKGLDRIPAKKKIGDKLNPSYNFRRLKNNPTSMNNNNQISKQI